MAWTIVPEHGRLHIRAIVRGRAEITEVIESLQKYLTLEECDDGPADIHARPTTELGADDAAARATGRAEAVAKTPLSIPQHTLTRSDLSPKKVAGGPIQACETSPAAKVEIVSDRPVINALTGRTVPRYPKSE